MSDLKNLYVVPSNSASTESTPNYHFPVFTANDKPSWLGSWNTAMTQIDNTLKEIDTKGSANKSEIETLQTALQTAQNAITTLQEAESGQTEKVNKNTADIASNTEKINNMAQDIIAQNELIKTLSQTVIEIQTKITALENSVNTITANICKIKMQNVGDVQQVVFPKYDNGCKLLALFGDINYGSFLYPLNKGDYAESHKVFVPVIPTGIYTIDIINEGEEPDFQARLDIVNNFEMTIAENEVEEQNKTITFTTLDTAILKTTTFQGGMGTSGEQYVAFNNVVYGMYGKVGE